MGYDVLHSADDQLLALGLVYRSAMGYDVLLSSDDRLLALVLVNRSDMGYDVLHSSEEQLLALGLVEVTRGMMYYYLLMIDISLCFRLLALVLVCRSDMRYDMLYCTLLMINFLLWFCFIELTWNIMDCILLMITFSLWV